MVHSKLGYQAFFAILFGIVAGIFFGPLCDILKPIGDLFVFTLQIVVIPYIPSLLMHGLGSLSPELAKKLFQKGWFVLLLLWLSVLAVCYVMKILIPAPLPSPASDFSLEAVAELPGQTVPTPQGNTAYLIFFNGIPIIALFSLVFGFAIMHLKQKDPLLSLLERINNSLERIIKWITIVAPIGIFAHVAYVMGTVHFDDLAKLQLYVGIIIATTLFLSIWVLPMVVSCLTSIPYKELWREYKIVGFLPFATGIPTIALPYINNAMRRLAERKNLDLGTFKATSQTIVPIGFGFAQIGNFLPLIFLFFLSFFYRHPISGYEMIALPLLVTFFSFGIPQFTFIALPYLLSVLSLPSQGFSLYAEISAITLNFQVLLSTVSMLSFMYLVVLRYYGLLEVQWRRLMFHVSIMTVALFAFVLIGKHFFHPVDNYNNLYYGLTMKKAISSLPHVTVYKEKVPAPPSKIESTLAKILDRGLIRVGYESSAIPFCYLNKDGELVGYDIAFAYQLAKDLDVKLELVPIDYDTLGEEINSGYCDIVMCAIVMNEQRILNMQFSDTYLEDANVLIIPTKNLDKYRTIEQVGKAGNFRLGAIGAYEEVAANHFPNVPVVHGTIDMLFANQCDGYLWAQLQSYIWCLAHPGYTALTYNGQMGKKYFAYPMRKNAEQLVHFVNEWMWLKQEQGFTYQQRQYWFLGKEHNPEAKRWSILRDVLHWVD
jgi:Na+/H+-dicarboxylate symporter/ABC-type amino acid transport substrate-binding protein